MPMKLLPETRIDGIEAVCRDWGLPPWDVLVAGDGSGAGWDKPAGWCAVVVDRTVARRAVLYGGTSRGSVAIAELLPYIQALSFHLAYREIRPRGERASVLRVQVVTDSKSLAQTGQALVARTKALADVVANAPLWAALMAFERCGYALQFAWKERATSALNAYCDQVARSAFHAMKDLPEPTDRDGNPLSIYDLNPSGGGPTPLDDQPRTVPRKKRTA